MSSASLPEAAEGARERLIEAGLQMFGAQGFHAATTRKLAERAGVNLAAIPYYFGTKENLYIAVADHIACRVRTHMQPAFESARWAAGDAKASPDLLKATLLMLLDRLAQLLLSEETSDEIGRFVLLEQISPTAAFDTLFEKGMRPLQAAVGGLLGRLMDRSVDDPEIRLRANMLLGQVIVFRATRALMLRSLGHDKYNDADRRMIRDLVSDHTRRLVDDLAEDPR